MTATPRNESEAQDRAHMVVNGKHLRPRWTLANHLVVSDSETEEEDSLFVIDSTAEAEEAFDCDNHQVGANQAPLRKSAKKGTVSNKTIPITNPNTVREAHCSHTWECRLALV